MQGFFVSALSKRILIVAVLAGLASASLVAGFGADAVASESGSNAATAPAVENAAVDPASGGPATRPVSEDIVMRLWTGDAPGALGKGEGDVPTLTRVGPAAGTSRGSTGPAAAVIVCPGGGYQHLAPHEGKPIGQWLNTLGIESFVLKYRLGPKYHHPCELEDVQRAIRLVRANAGAWNIDPTRIGIIGFSAGGHLASAAATHFDAGDPSAVDPIDRVSSRPDLALLIYPVITMEEPYAHKGSRDNLLGKGADPKLVELLSSDRQVTAQTPPCFLVATADDKVVPVENSLMFTAACRKNRVPVEVHVFEHGAHGFGLGGRDPELSTWPADAARWLGRHGFVGEGK